VSALAMSVVSWVVAARAVADQESLDSSASAAR
jgi:hypothetical protein